MHLDTSGLGAKLVSQLQPYRDDVAQWAEDDFEFWSLVRGQGHEISDEAQHFVKQWAQMTTSYGDRLFTEREPRRLIKKREIDKKKGNSRFTNVRLRDQWQGDSATRPMLYRWPVVRTFVNDMAKAFNR